MKKTAQIRGVIEDYYFYETIIKDLVPIYSVLPLSPAALYYKQTYDAVAYWLRTTYDQSSLLRIHKEHFPEKYI